MTHPTPWLPCLAVAAVLSTAGCTKAPEVVPADATSEARIAELERQISALSQANTGAGLAANVDGSERLDLRKTVSTLQQENQDLLARLSTLEKQVAAGSGSGGAAASVSALPLPTGGVAAPDAPIGEDQIAAFRRLADEVEKRKSAEAQADRVRRELKRAEVNLTPEQESAVLNLQQTYSEKMRDLFRTGFGTSEADRQAAVDKREALRNQYEVDLRVVVPAAEADKIVEAMRRGWPGFFPRRMDAGRNGMGN